MKDDSIIKDNDLLDQDCGATDQDENSEFGETLAKLMPDVEGMANWLDDFNARIKAEISQRKTQESEVYKELSKALLAVTLNAVTSYVNDELNDDITNIRLEVQEPSLPFPLIVFAKTSTGEVQLEYECQDERDPVIAELDALSADFNSQYGQDKNSTELLISKIEKSLKKTLINNK
jgi:hypothetical protein